MWARDEFSGTTFNGCIDEVRIFGRALDLDEIKEIYGEGDDGTCPPEEPGPEPEPENTAPTVNLETVDGEEINEGDTFTSSAGFFTDPDEGSWTATVDYGDDPDADPQALTLGEDKSFDPGAISEEALVDACCLAAFTENDMQAVKVPGARIIADVGAVPGPRGGHSNCPLCAGLGQQL